MIIYGMSDAVKLSPFSITAKELLPHLPLASFALTADTARRTIAQE